MKWLRGACALSMLALTTPRLHAATGEWERNGFDSDDLATLERRDPTFVAALLRGEAELRSGATRAAAATFKRLSERAPESALTLRRYCQALTELGERKTAITACEAAITQRQSAPVFRALVTTLMSVPPSPEDLFFATQLASAAQRRQDDQPWGLAAKAEIAERMGDEKMLQSAVVELERIAPGHYETLRARRALDGFHLPNWAWLGWAGLGAALLGTLAHAVGTPLRRRKQRRVLGVAAALVLVGATQTFARPALAADAPADAPGQGNPTDGSLSKWPVDDADPKKSLPTPAQRDGNPMEFGYHMMDLADKADRAKAKGDFMSVGKYYEAMSVAVPDRAIGYRKSCEGYEKAGDLEKALQMCRGALGAEGLEIGDYLHYAQLVLARPGALAPQEIDDLSEIATHLKAEQGGMAAGLQVQCNLAERLDDVKRLDECATAVAKETPNDPKLPIYQWGVAMKREDYAQARTILASARQGAIATPGIDVMDRMTEEQSAVGRRAARFTVRYALPLAVAFALVLALGFGLWFRKRLGARLA
ncbi:MAG TPA: hypothetical protein VER11_35295 [Polyangiaceae bacterium]|nr:hypothetical protein [Polyangiaceae bacterium]